MVKWSLSSEKFHLLNTQKHTFLPHILSSASTPERKIVCRCVLGGCFWLGYVALFLRWDDGFGCDGNDIDMDSVYSL